MSTVGDLSSPSAHTINNGGGNCYKTLVKNKLRNLVVVLCVTVGSQWEKVNNVTIEKSNGCKRV